MEMGEESKRMKIAETPITKASLLSCAVQQKLQDGFDKGLTNGYLDLSSKGIDDCMVPELCKWIIKLDNKVKMLKISSNGISMLFDTLKTSNLSIKFISMGCDERINDDCMRSFGEYLQNNKWIDNISITYSQISDKGIEILASYLDGNTTLKSVNFQANKAITNFSVPLLTRMIETSQLLSLDVNGTSICKKYSFAIPLARNAIRFGSKRLVHWNEYVDDNALIKICEFMKCHGVQNLKDITIGRSNITSKGAAALFDTLRECNSVVTSLELSYNSLDDECMSKLGAFVQDNGYIGKIDITGNKVSDKGVEILSDYLIGNIMLKKLYMNYNLGITDASTPHLAELARASHIAEIEFRNAVVSQIKRIEIDVLLKTPIDQRELPIRSNSKSAAKIS